MGEWPQIRFVAMHEQIAAAVTGVIEYHHSPPMHSQGTSSSEHLWSERQLAAPGPMYPYRLEPAPFFSAGSAAPFAKLAAVVDARASK